MTLVSLQSYGKSFQLKVLGALLTDKKFLQTVADILKEEYWDSPAHKWILQQILKYYEEYHCCITMEVLKIELQKIENDVLKVAVKEELRNSYKASQDDLEYVESEFTAFSRNQEMKGAILASADLLKNGDFEGIRALVENALKAGVEKSIGHEYKKDVETRYRDDYRPTVPFPWEPISNLFSGGLGPGDLFLIFGGPGAGKTWLAIAAAANALQAGYDVIYYSLELGESYVARRFDSYLTGYSIEECKDHREEIDELMKSLPGQLIIKEYPPKSATWSTIRGHLQKCIDDGIKPGLVVVDYIDYIRPGRGSKYSDRKEELDDVYVGGKALAKEFQIPVISPSQVNRAGARDRVVEGDKAAGSYDKLMIADGAMSLSRQAEDKVLGVARIHIMKNRYGEDGMTFNVQMDSSNGHIVFENEMDYGSMVSSVNGGEFRNSTSPSKIPLSSVNGDEFNLDRGLWESFFKKD